MKNFVRTYSLTFLLLFALTSILQAAEPPVHQVARIVGDDTAAGDRFGSTVALSAETALVGAPGHVINMDDRGAAYVFGRLAESSGSWPQELKWPSTVPHETYACSVAIDGDSAVIGVCAFNFGDAFLFQRGEGGSWGSGLRLSSGDGSGDFFGGRVSISGTTALVGASASDVAGSSFSGAAYIFEASQGWARSARLLADDASANAFFGEEVHLSDDANTAFVNSRVSEMSGLSTIYIFERPTTEGPQDWPLATRLVPSPDPGGDIGFGASMATRSGVLAVGAPGAGGVGAVYLFVRDAQATGGWRQFDTLSADDAASEDAFGASVSLEGDLLLVGAPGAGGGAAYLFREEGPEDWRQIAKIEGEEVQPDDAFGTSVSLSGGRALIGAPLDDETCPACDSGAVYVFDSVFFADGFESGDSSAWGGQLLR